jgi:flagellar basal-body rod protein FlgF
MSDGIYSALSGAIAQERALDVVANNVANVNTDGFRGDAVAFSESLSRARQGPTPSNLRYVEVERTRVDPSEGPVRQTGNPLDFALSGPAHFVVRTPSGDRLTRDGNFMLDTDGILRTSKGFPVLADNPSDPSRPEVYIANRSIPITVASDGTLSQGDNAIGRFRLEQFQSPEDARHEGDTLYVAAPGTQTVRADGRSTVFQGYLEGANVNAIRGMNELISANRSFEAFQKIIQTFRTLDDRTARDLGSSR